MKDANLQAELLQQELDAKRRAEEAARVAKLRAQREAAKAKKEAKKEQEKAKKADMLEKAEVTSSESLSRISRLCLTLVFFEYTDLL